MKVRIIIQSRLSSQRLPAKALLPISGVPAVVLCAKRAANTGREVVVATSIHTDDDLIVKTLNEYELPIYRAEKDDVLSRFVGASNDMDEDDILVRLTADNVFPDGALIDESIAEFISQQSDYLTTTFESTPAPYGLSLEIFKVGMLRLAQANTFDNYSREHVTPWITQNAKAPLCYIPKECRALQGASFLRCTIDYYEDYTNLHKIFNQFETPIQVSWYELVKILLEQAKENTKIDFNKKGTITYSGLTLGTVQLGLPYGINNVLGMPDNAIARQIIECAVKNGIKTFDTARAYGVSEERLGNILAGLPSVSVVTKLDPLNWLNERHDSNCVKSAVEASIYHSCYALKTQSLNTVLLHRSDYSQNHFQDIWEKLIEFKQQGIIQYLGVSVNSVDEAKRALMNQNVSHIQLPINILDWRWHENELMTLIQQREDVVIFARSVLLQGLLTINEKWPATTVELAAKIQQQIDHYVEKFKRKNRIDLCIAFIRSFPWINSIVLGVESLEQLKENIDYYTNPCLTEQQRDEVKDAFKYVCESLLTPSLWSSVNKQQYESTH